MEIVRRVQAVLVAPRREWLRIKAEPQPAADLFTSYVLALAAIPPAFQFFGHVLVGRRLPVVGRYTWPVGTALAEAVVSYIFVLASVVLFALIVNEVAPVFASAKSLPAALALAAYGMTPGWLAGVLHVVPGLWIVGTLASLYGLYILYLGLATPMLGTPRDKVPGYLGVAVVVAVVLYVVFDWILKLIFAVRYGRL